MVKTWKQLVHKYISNMLKGWVHIFTLVHDAAKSEDTNYLTTWRNDFQQWLNRINKHSHLLL